MSRSFLSISSLSREEFTFIIDSAIAQKKDQSLVKPVLTNKIFALLFEKKSTRTRLSFEIAVHQLGGKPLVLTEADLQLSRGESPEDTARVFGRMVDGIMARVANHKTLEIFASYSGVPVINGLSDRFHPCQALADFQTIKENNLTAGCHLVFLGDGSSNVAHSLIFAAAHYQCDITIVTPKALLPASDVLTTAIRLGGKPRIVHDPFEALADADVLYTDVWVSMGQEKETNKKIQLLEPYQINEKLLNACKKNPFVLHCLPAHKGEEISSEVFEQFAEKIFDQAENRLHAQKALIQFLYS